MTIRAEIGGPVPVTTKVGVINGRTTVSQGRDEPSLIVGARRVVGVPCGAVTIRAATGGPVLVVTEIDVATGGTMSSQSRDELSVFKRP